MTHELVSVDEAGVRLAHRLHTLHHHVCVHRATCAGGGRRSGQGSARNRGVRETCQEHLTNRAGAIYNTQVAQPPEGK